MLIKPLTTTNPNNSYPNSNIINTKLILNKSNELTTQPKPTPANSNLLAAPNAKEAEKTYIKGYLPTPQIVGELRKNGVANIFNPAWAKEVAAAKEKLGDNQQGALAFSNNGFVVVNNEHFTPEQNKKLAEFSLITGTPIEDTPLRVLNEMEKKPKLQKWADEFIGKHETALKGFLEDPSKGYTVKDGKRSYVMQGNPQSGEVASYYTKLHGGFRGFIQKNIGIINKVTGIIGTVASFIPGWGTVVALAANVIQKGANIIATGKAKLGDLFSTVASAIPGGARFAGLAEKAGQWIQTGKVKAKDLLDAAVSYFTAKPEGGIETK